MFPRAIPLDWAGSTRVTHPYAGRRHPEGPAAPRLACIRPAASVHPEPGSNSPLYKALILGASAPIYMPGSRLPYCVLSVSKIDFLFYDSDFLILSCNIISKNFRISLPDMQCAGSQLLRPLSPFGADCKYRLLDSNFQDFRRIFFYFFSPPSLFFPSVRLGSAKVRTVSLTSKSFRNFFYLFFPPRFPLFSYPSSLSKRMQKCRHSP